MLHSRMAHHLTFQISCCCYGGKPDRKGWEVIVYKYKIVRKSSWQELCRVKNLVILKVAAQKRKDQLGESRNRPWVVLIWANEDKFRANIQNSFQRQCSIKCVQLCFQNSGTNSVEGGKNVITLTSRYNFGREKFNSTNLEFFRAELKIKIDPVNYSRRDCLVAKIPTLDSSGRVLIIMVKFYSSWNILYKSKTRFDGRENVWSRTG